jgi:hypothetical protein
MTQADKIREFALDHYVAPARARGLALVTIRAGDIHREMKLANAMPAVCSAIGSNRFKQIAQVRSINRTGPANGANVYFEFGLATDPLPTQEVALEAKAPLRTSTPVRAGRNLDLADAVVLVSCVKSKRTHPAPARSLYTSAWFCKVCDLVEASGGKWFVLSALYGLVPPDAEIAPYEYTLNTLGVSDRRAWANKVLDKLLPEIADVKRVVILAGHRYREFLVEPLEQRGIGRSANGASEDWRATTLALRVLNEPTLRLSPSTLCLTASKSTSAEREFCQVSRGTVIGRRGASTSSSNQPRLAKKVGSGLGWSASARTPLEPDRVQHCASA